MGNEAHGQVKHGVLFWAFTALGWAVIAYGIRGVFIHSVETHPINMGIWMLGSAFGNDLILAPGALIVGRILARLIKGRFRAVVQATLVVAGLLTVASIPVLIAGGRDPDNPSILPFNYVTSLEIVLSVVAAAGCILALLVLIIRRKKPLQDDVMATTVSEQ
ncbi:MAG: hypothetical protein NVSMB57_14140 [Actinomycetota bacterium]